VQSRTWNGHEIPDEAAVDELARMLDGDPPAPWLAFIALASRSDPAALRLIVEQCGNVDPHKRRAAIEAIGASPIGTEAIECVRRALGDPAPSVVDAAIEAVGRLRDEASRARLAEFLRDRNPYYRGYALLALGEMWSDADFDAVFDIAQRDRDERNRKNAAFLLRDHPPMDWRRLVELWRDSELPRERGWVCDLIAERGEAADRALLERLRRDPDGHVRQRAEEALIALETRRK